MQDWLLFTLGLGTCALVQWTLLSLVPLSLTYYEGGQAFRRPIKLWTLIRHAHRRGVEMHGPLLYLDTGQQKGMVGGSWAALALAALVVGPWVARTELHVPGPTPGGQPRPPQRP